MFTNPKAYMMLTLVSGNISTRLLIHDNTFINKIATRYHEQKTVTFNEYQSFLFDEAFQELRSAFCLSQSCDQQS